jgi:GNAT superfamily N-acetyltransferase
LKKEQFSQIQEQLKNFSYHSFEPVEYDEIKDYDLVKCDDKIIIVYGYNSEAKLFEYHWACNSSRVLLESLSKQNNAEKITFIPAGWVDTFRNSGFDLFGVWIEYVAQNLSDHALDEHYKILKADKCDEASNVTLTCKGQSRGFIGQSKEWFEQWIRNEEPACPDYVSDPAVLISGQDQMSGIICVGLYGNPENRILWIRELAVRPEYQGKGIGKKLIGQAFSYGIKHGAKKAFLMADECNQNAIHLYERMGFKARDEGGQIDMIRVE